MPCVYSPYYEEGIGTIYFDAVNAFVNDRTSTITLEVATDVTPEAAEEGITLQGVATNDYGRLDWVPCPMDVFAVENVKTLVPLASGATNLTLASEGTYSNYFYRIRAQLNYRKPIRFRIRRLTLPGGSGGSDNAGLILLDNIIASFPPMSAVIHRFGSDFDPELKGKDVLGCYGDFDRPFMSGSEQAKPWAWLSFLTNSAANSAAQNTAITVSNPKLNYRWRYLNQIVGDWKSVDMTPSSFSSYLGVDSTNIVGGAGVQVSEGVGDLEYYFTADVRAPYYVVQDYACGVKYGAGWTEAITSVTNRGGVSNPALYGGDALTPAGGRDYFVRVREGESLFERVDLCTYLGTNTFAVTNCSMELVGNHTWRLHYYMPTNLAAAGESLGFWFQGRNRQEPGSTTYAVNTNNWYLREAVAEIPYLPFTSVAGGEETAHGRIPFDRQSTHLVFEFNDETGAFTMSHGGYQDFNAWTDAQSQQYVGNYVTTSGVSDAKRLYTCDFSIWGLTMGTNSWWSENFGSGGTGDGLYPFDEHFATKRTPNGWQATQGMFVSTDRTNRTDTATANTRALQMDGGGFGAIELSDLTEKNVPQGVDTFSLSARVAQKASFNGFTYSFDHMTRQNYAFSAKVAMSTVKNGTDMSPATPSVSLIANYRPTRGCYEFRIRRLTATRMELSLWKWHQNENGTGMTCTRMAAGTGKANGVLPTQTTKNPLITANDSGSPAGDYTSFSNYMVPTSDTTDACYRNWTTCYVSTYRGADGVMHVMGAMAKTANKNGAAAYVDPAPETRPAEADSNFVYIYCTDSDDPLLKGTCGVGSTDCKAYFGLLSLHETTAATTVDRTTAESLYVGTDDDFADSWANWSASSEIFTRTLNWTEGYQWGAGLKTLVPAAGLEMFTRVPGSDDKAGWTSRGITNVATFNMTPIVFRPQLTDLCYVRLATAGEDETGTGVVVDDLAIRQWRGQTDPELISEGIGLSTAWTYTEGWITSNGVSKTERALLLQPRRGSGVYPMGLRAPWLRNGMSMFAFEYKNAEPETSLLLQIATNQVNGRLMGLTYGSDSLNESEWTTLTNFSFGAMTATERASGALSYSMSLRAPVSGLVRVIMNPETIRAATNAALPETYGQVQITSALCYDEPALDDRAWWGWNLRTTGWASGKANEYAYLTDWSAGLSAGLNWSGTLEDNRAGADLADAEKGQYRQHDPFVQSPPFDLQSGIGNVSIRARKMYGATQSVDSVVRLLGAASKDAPDEDWTVITNWTVNCPTYQTFSWKTSVDESPYKVIRLSVPGVKDGRNRVDPPGQRVLIDEVSMFEPIAPKIALINLAPFRTNLGDSEMVITNIMSMDQQPLLGESWGVQVQVEPQQMGDELDMDHIRVFFSYKVGVDTWGITQWLPATEPSELRRVGTNLVFRSCYAEAASIVPPQEDPSGSVVVQYCVTAKYWDKSQDIHHDEPHVHQVTASEWSMPSWYRGSKGDLNKLYGGGLDEKFSPYTVLESISPRRAWINEINMYDGLDSLSQNLGLKKQFVEIAVPAGSDLKGWWLQLFDNNHNSAEFAVFGSMGLPSTKTANATNRYVFLTLCSPDTQKAGTYATDQVDGVWKSNLTTGAPDGQLRYSDPYGLRLVRPSGIWEHEIIFSATNTSTSRYRYLYDATNLCAQLNKADATARWRDVGKDETAGTLGVYRSHGENGQYPQAAWQDIANCSWTNNMAVTPGRVNQMANGTLQDIDENYYILPNGTNVWIYADVSGGHILEKFGTNLVENAVIVLPMENSTNIVYVLDRWYEVESITTNGVPVEDLASKLHKDADGNSVFDLKTVRSELKVVAKAGPTTKDPAIVAVKDSPYIEAVLDWLQQFDDSQEIKLAEYWSLSGDYQVPLDLVEMYWLNINPIEGDWVLRGGMASRADGGSAVKEKLPVPKPGGGYATNVVVTVKLMITNKTSNAASPLYGVAYPPDRLQGLVPGSTSNDGAGNVYNPKTDSNWTSVTFKVTGALQYGNVKDRWVPLRWFVFGPDSFDDDFTAEIEIRDPFQPDSPAAVEGWGAHSDCPVFYRWNINPELRPDTTEMLNSNSVFTTTSP
ncbi:MAG: hypothetical protein ACI4Q3_02000 [Kiritimatiellia bacterium]